MAKEKELQTMSKQREVPGRKATAPKAVAPRAATKAAGAGKRAASATKRAAPVAGVVKKNIPAPRVTASAQAVAGHAKPGIPETRPVRRNKRSDGTIANILAATEEVVLTSGAERISILEVCERAGVSRGTFYRYFSSQEELLDAFSLHKRKGFHEALQAVASPKHTPEARLAAVIDYLEDYLDFGRAQRLLLVAPEYALSFFKRVFHDATTRFSDVLGIVFEAWESQLGVSLDRELVSELLIRYLLSELMVPGGSDRRELPRRIGGLVATIYGVNAPRARRRA